MVRIPPELDEVDVAMPVDVARWYGVTTNPRCEKRAELSILDALRPRDRWGDMAVYMPVETYFARHARKVETKTRPLLVGYVFVCIRPDDMHVIRLCDGVRDFVRGPGGWPAPVILSELVKLRARVDAGEFDATRADDFGGTFKEGDPVEVSLGKFTGWPGRVVRMTSAEKVKVILSMFGKEHEKELPISELRAA